MATLDNIVDILKYAGNDLQRPMTAYAYTFLKNQHEALELFKKSLSKPNEMLSVFVEYSKHRRNSEKAFKSAIHKFSEEEALIIAKVNGISEILLDLMEARLAVR